MICLNVDYQTVLGFYFGCENSPQRAKQEEVREYAHYLQEFLHRFPVQWVSILYDTEESLSSIKENSSFYTLFCNDIILKNKPDIENSKQSISIVGYPWPIGELAEQFTNTFFLFKKQKMLDKALIEEEPYTAEYCKKYDKHIKSMVLKIDMEIQKTHCN